MQKTRTYNEIIKTFPNRVVLAKIATRDSETKFASSFIVLQSVKHNKGWERVLDYYKKSGMEDVVVIPTFVDEEPEFPPEVLAATVRQMLHE